MHDDSADLLLPRAVLFDMDGTLTEPMLDFPRIKRDMGIGDRPILEAMAEMHAPELSKATAILCGHEETAARQSTLNPGCKAVLEWLDARQIRTALITRNSRESVKTVLQRHNLNIQVMIAREDAPAKPDPAPLYLACTRLEVSKCACWMVGDGQFDIEAGAAAGIRTVWLSHGRRQSFACAPWREVKDLWKLLELLRRCAGLPQDRSSRD